VIPAELPVFSPANFCWQRGEGAWLYDQDGQAYLDFAAGIAVNGLGYNHPVAVNALLEAAHRPWHVSNLYACPERARLAQLLVEHSFADTVFFANSGSEAVECAIKMARKYGSATGRYRMITMEGGYHGRTMGALSASNRPLVKDGYAPLLDGFDCVSWEDAEAVAAVITPETVAILLEPIQGEGGMRVASATYLQRLRELADAHDLLLIYDEIQCGLGRSGALHAYLHSGIVPDVMTIAKSMGAGFPVSACLANKRAAATMHLGSHSSTFGGNPLAMAVAYAVLSEMSKPQLVAQVTRVGSYLMQALMQLATKFPQRIKEVRGCGLILGMVCEDRAQALVQACHRQRLLTSTAGAHVLRITPPLIIDESHVDDAIGRLHSALESL